MVAALAVGQPLPLGPMAVAVVEGWREEPELGGEVEGDVEAEEEDEAVEEEREGVDLTPALVPAPAPAGRRP